MKNIFLILAGIFFSNMMFAQEILSVNSTWDDDLREWDLYILDTLQDLEEIKGELRLTWMDESNWGEWDFRIGDISGDLRLRWQDDPSFWELRTENILVTARVVWRGDFTEWRITDGNTIVKFKSTWKNTLDEWRMTNKSYGEFYIYTSRNGDPRDWEIEDYTTEKVSFQIKLMMSFIAIINTATQFK